MRWKACFRGLVAICAAISPANAARRTLERNADDPRPFSPPHRRLWRVSRAVAASRARRRRGTARAPGPRRAGGARRGPCARSRAGHARRRRAGPRSRPADRGVGAVRARAGYRQERHATVETAALVALGGGLRRRGRGGHRGGRAGDLADRPPFQPGCKSAERIRSRRRRYRIQQRHARLERPMTVPGTRIKTWLIVSLVLNIFLLGTIAGGTYRWMAKQKAEVVAQQRGLRFAAAELPQERRDQLREMLRET